MMFCLTIDCFLQWEINGNLLNFSFNETKKDRKALLTGSDMALGISTRKSKPFKTLRCLETKPWRCLNPKDYSSFYE